MRKFLKAQKKTIIGCLIFWGLGLLVLLSLLLSYRRDLPSLAQLESYEPSLITRLYAADGEEIKEYYKEKRVLVPLKEMPPYLINALLATEDRKFYRHWGVDLHRIAGALWANLKAHRLVQGASTITQQLARTLFLTQKRTLSRKVKEALIAIRIEKTYSKDEILQMYLNQSYFGNGAYGVGAASQVYFSKEVRDLDINECALLVGLLKAANRYDPFDHPQRALRRRNLVINSLLAWGKISNPEADSLKSLPLELNPTVEAKGEAPYFTEMVRRYLEKKYGEEMLYRGGLSVYTTLDLRLQRAAEEAVERNLEGLQAKIEKSHPLSDTAYTILVPDSANGEERREYKKVQGALVAIEPGTGFIRALVGGRDFAESEFNRVTQAKRQPGSAFKPFVYTAAIDNGFKPTDIIYDTPVVLRDEKKGLWRPENYDHIFKGPTTLRTALALSRNVVSIKLLEKITPRQAVFYAHRMGIKTPLRAVPSLAIGTSEVTPLDLVSAYAIFPNQGVRVDPIYITRVTDREGKILEENSPYKEEVLNEQTAYIMTNMLESVMNRGTGYGARRRGFLRPAGGKTGTTDNFTDAWFVGFTPQLVAGVWVGFDDLTSLGEGETGARAALPIWTDFMIAAHRGLPVRDFPVPPGIVFVDVCAESGLLPTERCPKVVKEAFIKGTEPAQRCNLPHNIPKPPRLSPEGKQPPEEIHF